VWVPINVRGVTVGVLLSQALCETISDRAEARVEALELSPAEVERSRRHLRTLPKLGFDRAVRILELIADDVCQHVENDLGQAELQRFIRTVAAHEALETRLRKELNHVLPYVHENAASPETEDRSEKIVRQALEYIHNHSHRELPLQEVANVVVLNKCYFSTLFKKCMGIRFSRYLNELRIEKAQELLHDPGLRIADVAYAVGFADPNTFRLAFKRVTGLSPTAWRNTFHCTS
jgi:YesN/AraC family two-component response regulator